MSGWVKKKTIIETFLSRNKMYITMRLRLIKNELLYLIRLQGHNVINLELVFFETRKHFYNSFFIITLEDYLFKRDSLTFLCNTFIRLKL